MLLPRTHPPTRHALSNHTRTSLSAAAIKPCTSCQSTLLSFSPLTQHSSSRSAAPEQQQQRWRSRCVSLPAASVPQQQPGTTTAAPSSSNNSPSEAGSSILHNLLVWLVSNGVQGIGTEDSRLALYEDADGDRGILADQDIAAGEVLVRVPLRLAITDVMPEEEQQRVVGQGAMWQDRLVAKLLQERQKGAASPWHAYLQALPQTVPSAVETFSPAEADQVQLPSAVAAIKRHAAKMEASWNSCRPDAIGAADLAAYRWAHTVVMSRTFGNASPTGGVGVRMCVPLIDMLNHAGDEAIGGLLSSGDVVAQDNVRWDVVSPSSSGSDEWQMVLSATKPIADGQPLLLSYREGSNDEFLLNYGFVPASNPHDTVQLFGGLSEALEHFWEQELSQGKRREQLREVFQSAHDAGLQALQGEVAAAAEGVSDSVAWGQLLDALEPIQVASGSRVSGHLIAALEVLHQGDMGAVGGAVASLAWQQLHALPTSLLWDLAWLVQDGMQQQDAQQVQLFGGLLRHYLQAMTAAYEPELWQQLTAAATTAAAAATSGSSDGSSSSSSSSSSQLRAGKTRVVPGPPKASPPQQQQQQPEQTPQASQVAALPLQLLASTVLQHYHTQHCESQQNQQDQHQQQQHSGGGGCRLSCLRLAVKFRLNKKLLLADVLLAAPLPLQQLVEQQQRLEEYRASAAAMVSASSSTDGDVSDSELPWQS